MSGTDQKGRLRLVPLMDAGSGTAESIADRDRLLALASTGAACLYVPVPLGKVAYVDHLRPDVTITGSIGHPRPMLAAGQSAVDTDRRAGRPVIAYPVAHPEIKYLALESSHAEGLRATGQAHVHWFPRGLAPHPTEELRLQGWMVPRQFLSSVCLRTPAQTYDEMPHHTSPISGPLRGEPPEHTLRLGLGDIYVEERALAAPEGGMLLPSTEEDPHQLKSHAYGAYVLYCAAKHFYSSQHVATAAKVKRKDASAKREKAVDWLCDRGPKNLYGITVSKQAAKLIDPTYRRGIGVDPKDQKDFDRELLDDPSFIDQYKPTGSETDALALLIYATHWWINVLKAHALNAASTAKDPPSIKKGLKPKLKKLGFYGEEELTSVMSIITWKPAHSIPEPSSELA